MTGSNSVPAVKLGDELTGRGVAGRRRGASDRGGAERVVDLEPRRRTQCRAGGRRLGVGFVPYSPLGRGFLTGTVRSAADLSSPTDFRRNLPRFSEGALDANLAVVNVVRLVADEVGATAAQVALAWLRYRAGAQGVASVPIPGTRRAERVEENLGSLSVTLTPDQLAALDKAGTAVTGNRVEDLTWISAGRE